MRRALRALLVALAAVVGLLCAAAAGIALVHDTGAFRDAALGRLNAALAPVFEGRVTFERLGRLGLTSFDGLQARVEDPQGRLVLRLEGVRARVSTLALARSMMGSGDVVVDSPELFVARAEVSLDADDDGTLRIARALTPRPAAPSPRGGTSRGFQVTLRDVRVGHAWGHGLVAKGAPSIDADADDCVAAARITSEAFAIDVSRCRGTLRGLPRGAAGRGEVDAHLESPSSGRDVVGVRASWDGTLGGVRELARVRYDGELDAALDAPSVQPEALRSLWPACPFAEPASLHVEARGTPRALDLQLRASLGRATLSARGPASVDDGAGASLHLSAAAIDVRALSPDAPRSDLSADGDVTIRLLPGGSASAEFLLEARGSVEGARFPPATVRANLAYEPPPAIGPTLAVAAVLREPGAPTDVTMRLAPKGDSVVLDFDATTTVARLDRVDRLGPGARGHAVARVWGDLDLQTSQIDARLEGSAGDLSVDRLHVARATVRASARGVVTAPLLHAELSGEGLSVGRAHVSAWKVGADVAPDRSATLRNVVASVDEGAVHAGARAALVRLSPAEVRVDDAVIEGLGAPLRATLRVAPGALVVRARSQDVDLARLAGVTLLPGGTSGRLRLDVDASLRERGAEGHAVLDMSKVSVPGWPETTAHVDARLDGQVLSGRADATLGDVGSIAVSSSGLALAGGLPPVAPAWPGAAGAIDVDARADLAKLVAWLVPGARWSLAGLQGDVRARVDPGTGQAAVMAHVSDATGPPVTLAATAEAIPFAQLLRKAGALDVLRTTPFAVSVALPSRSLETLPEALGATRIRGVVSAAVGWRGTVQDPAVDLVASVQRLRGDRRILVLPLDLDLTAHYAGGRAQGSLLARTTRRQVFDARGDVQVRAADLLAGMRGTPVPWTAAAQAHLVDFPLETFTPLDNRQMRGHASAELTLEGLHGDARATLSLESEDLQVGEAALRAHAKAAFDGRTLDATARIDQGAGFAEARVRAGARWGAAVVPTLDSSSPATASFSAREFRLQVLEPWVTEVLTELDGNLTGDASIEVAPGSKRPTSRGTLSLEDGRLQLPWLGGPLRDASAKLTWTPDGVARLENATARVVDGRVQAAASARFDGLALEGAHMLVQVPRGGAIPVVVEGVKQGTVEGLFDLTASRTPDRRQVGVDVDMSKVRFELPPVAAHGVQSLGGVEGLRLASGPAPSAPEAVATATDGAVEGAAPSATRVTLRLGDGVQVTRGMDLDIRLQGQPSLWVDGRIRATGQVLLRGTMSVQGKTFTLERGTVTFGGDDPGDPQVQVTAWWAAPDGTVVYVDFHGPLKSGKVTLRSQPARSQGEIASLLLSGNADTSPSMASGTAAPAPSTVGVGGLAAPAPVDRMLGRIGLAGQVTTRVDVSSSTPRPGVEVQIARDITLRVAWVLGLPPPGRNPDTMLATLSWRFLRRWSLATTFGDAGTSIVDLIWQRRY